MKQTKIIFNSIISVVVLGTMSQVANAMEFPEYTAVTYEYGVKSTIETKGSLRGKFNSVKRTNKNTGGGACFGQVSNVGLPIVNDTTTEYTVTYFGETNHFGRDSIVWEQDVIVPAKAPNGAEVLAKKYMPVVIFNENEEYFPQSLDEILSYSTVDRDNYVQITKAKDKTMTNPHGYDEPTIQVKTGGPLKRYLTYNGHNKYYLDFEYLSNRCELEDSVSSYNNDLSNATCSYRGLNYNPTYLRLSTGSLDNSTIYWDAVEKDDEVYLTYYFFYAFDPKNEPPTLPSRFSHPMDRESFTIILQKESDEYVPRQAVYAGHLADQDMKLKNGSETLVEWGGGKTSINWQNTQKIDTHPIIYKAQGAHAIYPINGSYAVDSYAKGFQVIPEGLTEPAGSDEDLDNGLGKFLLPNEDTVNLVNLDLNTLSYLSFSGYWVDAVADSKFPPFIRTPVTEWANTNKEPFTASQRVTDFDLCFPMNTSFSECNRVREKFEYIHGLNNIRATTIQVVDIVSQEPVSNATVILDEYWVEIQRALTDNEGKHTFFFPAKPTNYLLAVLLPNGQEVECATIEDYVAGVVPLKNNNPIIECQVDYSQVTGIANGRIVSAVTDEAITGASVTVTKDGTEIQRIYSSTDGRYEITLPTGNYEFLVEAPGYLDEYIGVSIIEGGTTTITQLKQIPEQYDGQGYARGLVDDAATAEIIADATINIRRGVDMRNGDIIKTKVTNERGNYAVSLPAGNYTFEITKTGYATAYKNVLVIGDQDNSNQNASLSASFSDGIYRIVMSWGDLPRDLDSHIWTPSISGDNYHIYYSNSGTNNAVPHVALDRDDTDGKGPETITISQKYTGTYYYSVYNFSGSPDIKTSQAKVEVYDGDRLIRTYNIPLTGEGEYWNVFKFDGNTGQITGINSINPQPFVN